MEKEKEITKKNSEIAVTDELADVQRMANIFVKSGFFKDAKDLAQACVKILAGRELGFSPMASMTGVYIVEGKPALSANLLSSKISTSGFRYEVASLTDVECILNFYQGNQSLGVSSFTIKDAERAGLANKQVWKNYPRNMLFARAVSNGAKWYCSAAFGGQTPYLPEELGAEVGADGSPKMAKVKEASSLNELLEDAV